MLKADESKRLFEVLRHDAKHFGPELAQLAFDKGLAVTDKSTGAQTAIPLTATPVILEESELKTRQQVAAQLASATLKMANVALTESELRPLVFDGLSPLEKVLAESTFQKLTTLATTRVDFFVGSKNLRALEVNATIPAMQGYSDIAAHTFLDVVGRHFGASSQIPDWQARNGSNTLALFRALKSSFHRVRGLSTPLESVALLCRRNDAQLTEQHYLCERFREFGVDAEVVFPDELSGEKHVEARGKQFQLLYRHVFVRRLEEPNFAGAEYLSAVLREPNGKRCVLFNPAASHVEVKAVFALMSASLEDDTWAKKAQLTPDEMQAINETVPWTRAFKGQALLKLVQENPEAYVLKRSWDYGGRAVFVGKTAQTPSFSQRAIAAYGAALPWQALCERAEADTVGGGFVVQQLVDLPTTPHVLCEGNQQTPVELFVDFSAYASVGLEEQPSWGGVCRGSISHIVNIVGGGGVVPLLTASVAQSLYAAFLAWKDR
jgi:hypothetical protein